MIIDSFDKASYVIIIKRVGISGIVGGKHASTPASSNEKILLSHLIYQINDISDELNNKTLSNTVNNLLIMNTLQGSCVEYTGSVYIIISYRHVHVARVYVLACIIYELKEVKRTCLSQIKSLLSPKKL